MHVETDTFCKTVKRMHFVWNDLIPSSSEHFNNETEKKFMEQYFEAGGQKFSAKERIKAKLCNLKVEDEAKSEEIIKQITNNCKRNLMNKFGEVGAQVTTFLHAITASMRIWAASTKLRSKRGPVEEVGTEGAMDSQYLYSVMGWLAQKQ
ncbi:hypothetical protein BDV98DRAFT_599057 [Pterulicium gracile]|uniref:Uncharacterized protein n=1 Tax=Pterulicium gracile TaxID=1884261 RepID=A0A5C3Q0M9_9AGAR|nr:hypothetical protein BDV98DRAFT_599057 [Pterula gracilis]